MKSQTKNKYPLIDPEWAEDNSYFFLIQEKKKIPNFLKNKYFNESFLQKKKKK